VKLAMQALVRKKFVLYYSPEFAGGERTQIVNGVDFFTETRGFKRMEIDEIGNMDPMDSIKIGPLMVWRVK